MVIVSGIIDVDPDARGASLADCRPVIEQARRAPGCLDFHLSADPIETSRINVYEQWETVADVEAFRGSGPSDVPSTDIRSAAVFQHEIRASRAL